MPKRWPAMEGDLQDQQVFQVEWYDTVTTLGWFSAEEQDGDDRLLCHSVGYMVRRTDQEITLSTSINALGHYGDRITIPMGMVRKVKKVRL